MACWWCRSPRPCIAWRRPSSCSAAAWCWTSARSSTSSRCARRLEASGYRYVDTVYEHGEFTVRGSLIDLFPMGSKLPYRIDLFDDEIETLRTFDPENQRSIDKVDPVKPAAGARNSRCRKMPVTRFKARFRERFDVDFRRCPIFQDLSSGITPAGIEYYLPLFFEETSTLFDYLPQDTQVFSLPGIEQAAENFWNDVRNRYEERRVDPSRPLLPPAELFLPVEDCFARLKNWPRVVASQQDVETGVGRERFPARELPNLAIEAKATQPLGGAGRLPRRIPRSRAVYRRVRGPSRSAAGTARTPEAAPENRRQLAGLCRRARSAWRSPSRRWTKAWCWTTRPWRWSPKARCSASA